MNASSLRRRVTVLFGVILAMMVAVLLAVVSDRIPGSMESSWAYEQGVALARADPRVQEQLGQPLQFGRVEGGVRVSGETGDAELTIPLSGSRGQGTLTLIARKRYDRWQFERAAVQTSDGGRIDLLDTDDGSDAEP